MQVSRVSRVSRVSPVALVAAPGGIVLEYPGPGPPFIAIIGDALIVGAFSIAITVFTLFLEERFSGPGADKIAGSSR